MPTRPTGEDSAVLALKLQAISRHIDHYEDLIIKVDVGVEKVIELGDFELPGVIIEFRDVLAEAWQPPPTTSLVSDDLARVERELGDDYAGEKARVVDKLVAVQGRQASLMRAGDAPKEQFVTVLEQLATALALYESALKPARLLRQQLVAQLNQATTADAPTGREPQPEIVRAKTDDARDQWIYEQVCKKRIYKEIAAELKRKSQETGWRPIDSVQGIRSAALAYARRHNLNAPPARQEK